MEIYEVLLIQTDLIKGSGICKKEIKSHYIFENFTEALLFSKRTADRLNTAYTPKFEIDNFVKECAEAVINGRSMEKLTPHCTDETFGELLYSYEAGFYDLYEELPAHFPQTSLKDERLHHTFIYSFEIYERKLIDADCKIDVEDLLHV